MTEIVTIDRIGHRGDGIVDKDRGTIYVPFTLPGEVVEIERRDDRGRPMEILAPSPDRIRPVCRHFTRCGGCALQHMAEKPYLAFKRDLVRAALAHEGIAAEIAPTVAFPEARRRRAVFVAGRAGATIAVGFHGRMSHDVVPVEHCPVLDDRITAALPQLNGLARRLALGKSGAKLTVLATAAGLDVAIDGGVRINDGAVAHLAKFAVDAGFARLSLAGEVLLESRPPTLDLGGTQLVPPPGGFVQALTEAEAFIADRISQAVGEARHVADLFCGSGAFALRLARTATVYAVESDPAAVVALDRATRRAEGLKKITTDRRDLFRRPLRKGELDGFEAVVLDPPRAGAKAAVEELAGSAVPTIAAVSCNPATFARDARILLAGGYRLGEVVPLDQFRYSPHVELLAVFHRT